MPFRFELLNSRSGAFLPISALALALLSGCSTSTSAGNSVQLPTVRATHIQDDFIPDGDLSKPAWRKAKLVRMERESKTTTPRPEFSTTVRVLWSDRFLYLAYDCPYTKLTVFDPPQATERFGLWEKDVVEAFIAADTNDFHHYTEYEVSPTNERLDVKIPEKDFAWSSHFESATRVDEGKKHWTAEMRIPLSALGAIKPAPGARWRINFYRCDYTGKAFLAFSPTLTSTFHTPDKFGVLEFGR